jgi:hypothetical protein
MRKKAVMPAFYEIDKERKLVTRMGPCFMRSFISYEASLILLPLPLLTHQTAQKGMSFVPKLFLRFSRVEGTCDFHRVSFEFNHLNPFACFAFQ